MRTEIFSDKFTKDVGDKEEYIAKLHRRKTEIFMEIVSSGSLPLRSGIRRLICESRDSEMKTAVCSTANEKAVYALIRTLLGDETHDRFDAILAGDVVKQKKPSPEIYELAVQRLGLDPSECIVIEDSRNGLLAAKGAGMRCVITQNLYTKNENPDDADLVLDCLGDPDGEVVHVICSKVLLPDLKYLTVDHLRMLFE